MAMVRAGKEARRTCHTRPRKRGDAGGQIRGKRGKLAPWCGSGEGWRKARSGSADVEHGECPRDRGSARKPLGWWCRRLWRRLAWSGLSLRPWRAGDWQLRGCVVRVEDRLVWATARLRGEEDQCRGPK